MLVPAAAAAAGVVVAVLMQVGGTPDDDGSGNSPTTSPQPTASTASPTRSPAQVGWAAEPNYPTDVESAGAATWRDRVWVVGGNRYAPGKRDVRPKLKAVFSYNPAESSKGWVPGPALPRPMDHMALVSTGESLYVIGGSDGKVAFRTVYRLDDPAGRWEADTPLPAPRQAGVAVWDPKENRIVHAGGIGGDGESTSEVWALEGGSWRLLGRLQGGRNHLATAMDGEGNVYFVGGDDNGKQKGRAYASVDVLTGDEVRRAPNLGTPRRALGAVVLPGAGLCIFGGNDGSGIQGNFVCRKKATAPPLDPPRAGFATAELAGRLYLVGGFYPGHMTSDIVQSLAIAP